MKKRLATVLAAAALGLMALPAQATPAVGKPVDQLVGCDNVDACSIRLDEVGNISGSFNGFFGPYTVFLSHILSTVNPAFVDNQGRALEVTSYLVRGSAGFVPLELQAGALGLCDGGVTADGSACTGVGGDLKGDVLLFTSLGIDAQGFGNTRIDMLSDVGSDFTFQTDFNVLEVGLQGNNGATHRAFGTDNAERMTYFITSDPGPDQVPEPASLTLVGLALGCLAWRQRKQKS